MPEIKGRTLQRRASWPSFSKRQPFHIVSLKNTLQNVAFAQCGTPYSITDYELSILQNPNISQRQHPWRPFPPAIGLTEAHAELELFAHSG